VLLIIKDIGGEDLLGKYLKEKREQAGVSLRDIADATHIRLEYLRALEEEDFSKIPGEVYITGYISEYLRYLNVDPADAVQMYRALKKESVSVDDKRSQPSWKPMLKYAYLVVAMALLIIPVYFFLKSTGNRSELKMQPVSEEVAKKGSDDLISILKPSVTAAEADYKNRHILKVEASEESWILIRIDDDITYSMVLRPGEIRTWSAEKGFYLKTGNAGGIKISFDEKMLGSPGKRGAVVSLNLPKDIKKFIRH